MSGAEQKLPIIIFSTSMDMSCWRRTIPITTLYETWRLFKGKSNKLDVITIISEAVLFQPARDKFAYACHSILYGVVNHKNNNHFAKMVAKWNRCSKRLGRYPWRSEIVIRVTNNGFQLVASNRICYGGCIERNLRIYNDGFRHYSWDHLNIQGFGRKFLSYLKLASIGPIW
jgi:hypothetical protein